MNRTAPAAALAGLVLSSALTLLSPATPASAAAPVAITGRASVLPGAQEPATTGDSTDARVSGGGRYVIFSSTARLVPGDTDTRKDVYRKDLLTDAVVRVNATTNGAAASQDSTAGAITPDGRYVAYWSWASNLVTGDSNNKADVFVRDLAPFGTTKRVSVSSAEAQGSGNSPNDQDGTIDISNDGRYVTFSSTAANFGIDADVNSDIFLRDLTAGTTELISVSGAEISTDGDSYHPSMSADGRYIAFESGATNLVASDTNGTTDAFVRDRMLGGNTHRISVHDNDAQSPTGGTKPWIDDSGAKVAFTSTSKLNGIDPNSTADVFIRDRGPATTMVGSVGSDGWAAGLSSDPTISGDGATVAFQSTSPKVKAGGNGWEHIYTRKITTTTRVTVSTAGVVATGTSSHPSLSTDGTVVAFDSKSPNLVQGDSGFRDAFFRRPVILGPFANPTTFVQRQLQDFTGSQKAGEIEARTLALAAGASPEHLLIDLANAPAFAGKRPPLIRLYVAYFKRMPDLSGMNYWLGKLNGGQTLDQVSAKFADSNEFKTKYGNTTNTQFVTLVYNNVFDRAPDQAGLNHWVGKLNGGMARGTVMTNFSESSEGKRHFNPWVQATLLGLGMLDRLPTGEMLAGMLAATKADSPEAAAQMLLRSAEYSTYIV